MERNSNSEKALGILASVKALISFNDPDQLHLGPLPTHSDHRPQSPI